MAEPLRTDLARARSHLRELSDRHPFWDNRLLRACSDGALTRDDLRFVFEQYYFYSRSFTRYLAAVMASCDNDLFRARLTENLWQESGGEAPERRHAELLRGFLRGALDLDPERLEIHDATRNFVREFHAFCVRAPASAGAAFLSYGTEAIVPGIYRAFMEGLLAAGIGEEHLEFFRIHIECDDDHAATLEEMACSYHEEPGWESTCAQAIRHALDLRLELFERLMDALPQHRLAPLQRRVQAGASLAEPGAPVVHRAGAPGQLLYANREDGAGIALHVDRVPFGAEVLDPRIARIPAGRSNERHHHAHETLMYFIQGSAVVQVDDAHHPAGPGDLVFVPRWAFHQVENTGTDEVVYLAVTDHGFASRAFVGDYLAGHRAAPERDRSGNGGNDAGR